MGCTAFGAMLGRGRASHCNKRMGILIKGTEEADLAVYFVAAHF